MSGDYAEAVGAHLAGYLEDAAPLGGPCGAMARALLEVEIVAHGWAAAGPGVSVPALEAAAEIVAALERGLGGAT